MAFMSNQLKTGERKLVYIDDHNRKRLYPLLVEELDYRDYQEITTYDFGKTMIDLVDTKYREDSEYWLKAIF